MSDEREEPERVWDEYDWERFLKQQDQRAHRYLELMERYSDHPQRDWIVAQEMGWCEFSSDEVLVWMSEEETRSQGEELEAMEEGETKSVDSTDSLEGHPLYGRVLSLMTWLDGVFERKGESFCENSAAMELSDQLCELAARLVAALSDERDGERAMTIAYLKRALHALHECLNAAFRLYRQRGIGRVRANHLRKCLLEIRNEIVEKMGECRRQMRRELGEG
jgi:hypothetical protein